MADEGLKAAQGGDGRQELSELRGTLRREAEETLELCDLLQAEAGDDVRPMAF